MSRLWYVDAKNRSRDFETRKYAQRGRPEDERPAPPPRKRIRRRARARDPQPPAIQAPQDSPPTFTTKPGEPWTPDAPPPPPIEAPEPDETEDETASTHPAGWAPEETPEVQPEPEPEPEPPPQIETKALLEQLQFGALWAVAVRYMADPKQRMQPAPITPNETTMYEDAWAAVFDRYMPDLAVGPLGQLAIVTAIGVASARGNRVPRVQLDEQTEPEQKAAA